MENPIKLSELLDLDTKGRTVLQIDSMFEPFIGKTFEIVGEISNIGRDKLYFFPFAEHTEVNIAFSPASIRDQLLAINKNDIVKINAKLEHFFVGHFKSRYYFSLITITKTDLPTSKPTERIQHNNEETTRIERNHEIIEDITSILRSPEIKLSSSDIEKENNRIESKIKGHLILKIICQIAGSLWGYYLGYAIAVKICSTGFVFGKSLPFYLSFCMIAFGYLGGTLGMKILRFMEKSKGEWDEAVEVKLSFWNWVHLGYPYFVAPVFTTLMNEDFNFGLLNGFSTITIFYFMYLMNAFKTVQEKTGRGFKTAFGTIDEIKNVSYQNYTPKKYSGTIAFFHFLCGCIMLIYLLAFK